MPYQDYLLLKENRLGSDSIWVRPEPYEYAKSDWVTVEFLVPKNHDELWTSGKILEGTEMRVTHPTIRPDFKYVIGMFPGEHLKKQGIKSESHDRRGIKTKLPKMFEEIKKR